MQDFTLQELEIVHFLLDTNLKTASGLVSAWSYELYLRIIFQTQIIQNLFIANRLLFFKSKAV